MSSISYTSSGGFILGFDHRLLDSSNNPITDSNNEYIYTDTWTTLLVTQDSFGGFLLGGNADNSSSALYQEESYTSSGGFVIGFDHRLLDSSNNPITDSDYNFIYTDTWTTSLVKQNILGGGVIGGTSPNNSSTNISSIDFISSGGFITGFNTYLNASISVIYNPSEGIILSGISNNSFVVDINPVDGILFGGSASQTIKSPSYQDHIGIGGFVLGADTVNTTSVVHPTSAGFLLGSSSLITCKQSQESDSGFILGSTNQYPLTTSKSSYNSSASFILGFPDLEVSASVKSIPTNGAIAGGEAELTSAGLIQYSYISSGGFLAGGIFEQSSLSSNISFGDFLLGGKFTQNNIVNHSVSDGLVVGGSLAHSKSVKQFSFSGIIAGGTGGPFITNGIINFGYTAVGGSLFGGSSLFNVSKKQESSSGLVFGNESDFKFSFSYLPQSGCLVGGSLLDKSKISFSSTSGFVSSGQAQNRQTFNNSSFGGIVFAGNMSFIYTGMLSDIINPYIINHTTDYYITSQQQNFYFHNKTTSRYISAEV